MSGGDFDIKTNQADQLNMDTNGDSIPMQACLGQVGEAAPKWTTLSTLLVLQLKSACHCQ